MGDLPERGRLLSGVGVELDPDAFEIAQSLEEHLRSGFLSFEELEALMLEYAESEEWDPELVSLVVADRWDARVLEQAEWPAETDSDRLDRAFEELERAGIVARMNYTCCGTCGHGELSEEAAAVSGARGYVFFHEQAAERIGWGSVYLSYGVLGADDLPEPKWEAASVKIGHEVVASLSAAGFEVSWDGSLSHNILVDNLDWKRRIPRRR